MKRGPYKGSLRWTIEQISHEKFAQIVRESNNTQEVIRKLGFVMNPGGSHAVIRSITLDRKLDTTHFNTRGIGQKRTALEHELRNVFIQDSSYKSCKVRRHALRHPDKIPYICQECGIGPEWKSKKLTLVLDHINGVNNDNRFENLRFLCPNCHSQTETFAGRNTHRGVMQLGSMQDSDS